MFLIRPTGGHACEAVCIRNIYVIVRYGEDVCQIQQIHR